MGWTAHPIFSEKGNYPSVMINDIAVNSMREGRPWSRLPTFSDEWINLIRGSADFFGLNYYTSLIVETPVHPDSVGESPSYERDRNLIIKIDPNWKPSASNWIYYVPQGLGDLLRYVFGVKNKKR